MCLQTEHVQYKQINMYVLLTVETLSRRYKSELSNREGNIFRDRLISVLLAFLWKVPVVNTASVFELSELYVQQQKLEI